MEVKTGDRDIAVLTGIGWSGEKEESECTVYDSVSVVTGCPDATLSDTRGRREDVEEDVKLEPSCRSLVS